MPLASISARTRSTASARPSELVNRSRSVLTRPPGRDVNLRTVNPVSWDDTTPGPALVLVRRRAGPASRVIPARFLRLVSVAELTSRRGAAPPGLRSEGRATREGGASQRPGGERETPRAKPAVPEFAAGEDN